MCQVFARACAPRLIPTSLAQESPTGLYANRPTRGPARFQRGTHISRVSSLEPTCPNIVQRDRSLHQRCHLLIMKVSLPHLHQLALFFLMLRPKGNGARAHGAIRQCSASVWTRNLPATNRHDFKS